MRWKFLLSDQSRCDAGLRGGAGLEGRELEELDGRPLCLLSEDLEESENETLWPGDNRLPSDVLGLCQRCDMIAGHAQGQVGGVLD